MVINMVCMVGRCKLDLNFTQLDPGLTPGCPQFDPNLTLG